MSAIRYHWARHPDGERLLDIGIGSDGSLINPNGYEPERVRQAIQAAEQRRTERRQRAARKGAETRRRRHERRVHEIARRITAEQPVGPNGCCQSCGRVLSDPESIARGIGTECWETVLREIERLRGAA